MQILIVLLSITFSLGQLLRIDTGFNFVLPINDCFIIVLCFVWIFRKIIKKDSIIIDEVFKAGLIFIGIAALSLIIKYPTSPLSDFLIGILYLARWVVYLFLYLLLINEKIEEKKIIKSIFLAIGLISLIGIIQYLFLPDLSFLVINNWDPHINRLTAPFLDPVYTGAIQVIFLIFLISYLWEQKKSLFHYFLLSFSYINLSLTYSRASYIYFLFAMIGISVIKRSIKFCLFILLLCIFTYLILPKATSYGTKLERNETAYARLINWKNGFNIWLENPLIGVGFNLIKRVQINKNYIYSFDASKNHAGSGLDSSIIFIMATTGIVGLFFYLNFIKTLIKKALLNINNYAGLTLMMVVLGLLIHSLFANSLFYAWIMEIVFILTALIKISKKNY